MKFDYEIDTNGTQRMVLLRIIYAWLINVSNEVYLTPTVEKIEHGIELGTFYSVLYELQGRELISITFEPNLTMTDEQRARKDDEQDYFHFTVLNGFKEYYLAVDTSSQYHDKELDNELVKKPPLKVRYDKTAQTLAYGDEIIRITGKIQHEICKQVFKNRKNSIPYDSILDEIDENKSSKTVYDAIILLNKKMQENFGLEKVLKIHKETVAISKNYL